MVMTWHACATPEQDLEHARLKADRQSQLLVAAEMARAAASEEKRRLEAAFARSDRGAALLRATRLKLELQEAREALTATNTRLAQQARGCMQVAWGPAAWVPHAFVWAEWFIAMAPVYQDR